MNIFAHLGYPETTTDFSIEFEQDSWIVTATGTLEVVTKRFKEDYDGSFGSGYDTKEVISVKLSNLSVSMTEYDEESGEELTIVSGDRVDKIKEKLIKETTW